MSNILRHHGILGQKWGLRRFQNPDGSLTPAGKKRYTKGTPGKHGMFMGQDRDKDIRLKKGTIVTRLQEGTELKDVNNYISGLKSDTLTYVSATATGEHGLNLDFKDLSKKNNILHLKLTEDLIAPSYEATMDSFVKTLSKVNVKDIASTLPTYKQKEFIKNVKHLKVEDLRDAAYEDFSVTLFRDTKARQIFFDDLKAKGYNAIIDEADKGFGKTGAFTKAPMITFEKPFKITKVKNISPEDIDYLSDLYYSGVTTADDSDHLGKMLKESEYRRIDKFHPGKRKKWKEYE